MAKLKAKQKQAAVKTASGFVWKENHTALLLGAFAFILYVQTINYDYALDDIAVIRQNKFVHLGFGGIGQILHTFYWAGFWDTNAGLFRPVSLILFAVEWAFAPDSPHVFHFTNVLLYAVCSFLLFRTLRKLFRDLSVWFSIGVTLLWIVLPVHTEVVANIKSGDEILSLIFFLLMMDRFLKWWDEKKIKSLLWSAFFLFLSLLSKEGAVLFIPMAFFAIWMFREKEWKQLVKPLTVFAAVTLVWYVWHALVIANAPVKMISYDRGDNSLTAAHELLHRFATAMSMQGKYFQKLFLGYPLAYDYSYNQEPIVGIGDPVTLIAIVVCIALVYFAFKKFKSEPVISFGIIFYFITFALTSNVLILVGATMADRFLFVPSIGSSIALVYLLMKFMKADKNILLSSKIIYFLLPVCIIYSWRTFSRSQDWETEAKLFTADAEVSPGSGRVRQNYGIVLMNAAFAIKDKNDPQRKDMLDRSYVELTTAAKIDTSDFRSLLCLGQVEYNRGHYKESAAWSKNNIDFFHVRKYEPNDLTVYSNLCDAYMMYQRYDSAAWACAGGLKANPKNDYLSTNLGEAYLNMRDTLKAIAQFENSVKLNPKSDRAWDKLANVNGMAGNYDRSTAAFLELIKLRPQDPSPYRMIETNYLKQHDTADAQYYFDQYTKMGGK
ncbi:MAG: glycosyltransferase family 39 protein [Bacteroidetes bacterium]|nr:glycosyltransferase family 39 protein [Bacteroidota bacterium]